MNETCGKGKGKGNGGKGEHGGIGEDGGKGIQQQSMKMMKGEEEQVTDEEDERVQVAPNMGAGGSHPQAMLDPEEEADEEMGGTRNLRWADCEEEEGARQGAAEGEWHKARKEQGIMWLDGSDEEREGHGGSTGGERCEVCGRVEVWNEESEEQEERGGQGGKGARQKMPSEEDEEDERTEVAPNTGAGGSHSRATTDPEEEVKEEEVTGEEMADEKPPGLEAVKSEQEAREEQRRAQEAPELRRSESEVNAQEERTEQERKVEAQGGQEEDVNSVHDECHVSNRHMTWWHNAWWIRVDNGPHMRSARGRRRTWRAARQAAEQVRDGNWVGETRWEERERLKKGERGEERQHRKNNEATLHLILHVAQQQHQQQ